ncbi:MAG: YciI family protein [Rhodospirillaceae bacterium]|nr:YciI family protein [Rhodospirillaceae bacterium]MEA4837287.1 YciI family protein [Rhodospirillaceae bacterium]
MLFFVHCIDKPNRRDVRPANRPAHLEFMKKLGDKVVLGGPTLAEDGETMTGSVLILDMPDRAAVETLMDNEPYFKAGLFEAVIIRPYKKVLGA